MKLAGTLLQKCKEKGLTLSRVSKDTGVKQATLHGWSTGRSSYKLEDLKKISAYLEISLHELIFGEEDPLNKKKERIIFEGEVEIIIRRKT